MPAGKCAKALMSMTNLPVEGQRPDDLSGEAEGGESCAHAFLSHEPLITRVSHDPMLYGSSLETESTQQHTSESDTDSVRVTRVASGGESRAAKRRGRERGRGRGKLTQTYVLSS